MHRVSVCYPHPEDHSAFNEYYTSKHTPIARQIPGLSAFTVGHCQALDGQGPAYYLVATLEFADEAALSAGLASPQMQAAAADLANFAPPGVVMYLQDCRDALVGS